MHRSRARRTYPYPRLGEEGKCHWRPGRRGHGRLRLTPLPTAHYEHLSVFIAIVDVRVYGTLTRERLLLHAISPVRPRARAEPFERHVRRDVPRYKIYNMYNGKSLSLWLLYVQRTRFEVRIACKLDTRYIGFGRNGLGGNMRRNEKPQFFNRRRTDGGSALLGWPESSEIQSSFFDAYAPPSPV